MTATDEIVIEVKRLAKTGGAITMDVTRCSLIIDSHSDERTISGFSAVSGFPSFRSPAATGKRCCQRSAFVIFAIPTNALQMLSAAENRYFNDFAFRALSS